MAPKNKGKAAATPASTSATSSSTPVASSSAPAAPARRVPVGKVIHTWVDTMNDPVQQGYDGTRYQAAYQDLILGPAREVLEKMQREMLQAEEGEAKGKKGKATEQEGTAGDDDEDVQQLVKLGVSKTEAKALLQQAGKKGDKDRITEAARLYLRSSSTASNGAASVASPISA